MNYAANVSGGANHHFHDGGCGGFNVSWILVLFILLVIISCVC
ncbi:sporulation protein YjcZ [Paenibacillus endoradicis]|nr:sporulation protein YjcZ [Paenibacillus endoradicis]MCR8657099.1 sporulation protein YjcZ [Paenibacillus endoradicis]